MSAPRWKNLNAGDFTPSTPLLEAPPPETILSRNPPPENLGTTPIQNQIDGLVSGFITQASDWKSLAAMTAGGLAYRWGKISVLKVGAIRESPLLARPLAITFGLTTEVSAFEFTHRSLSTLSLEGEGRGEGGPTNHWKWNGPGGWKEGLLTSFITFGSIKSLGKLSQGQNLVLQHGFQSTGMVVGHQLVYRAGIGPRPEGSLGEQFVHAEVTNLQIGAGMALGHSLTGGRILALERGMDLSIRQNSIATVGPGSKIIKTMQPLLATGGRGEKRTQFLPHILLAEKKGTKSEVGEKKPPPDNKGVKEDRKPLEIVGDFSFADPKKWTEAEIEAVVRAIVAQDGELYPNGDASPMNAGAKYYRNRLYRIEGQQFSLQTLTDRVQKTRGIKWGDKRRSKKAQILQEWREKLFGIKREDRNALPIQVGIKDFDKPTEKEIDEIVRAIVAQDKELYPQGDISPMTSGGKYFRNRWYKVGDLEFCLGTLVLWVRSARGLRAGDTKALNDSTIVNEWKKRLFGIYPPEKTRNLLPITIDFSLSKNPTTNEIEMLLKAIAEQDREYYPQGDLSTLSVSSKYFLHRWYKIGEQELTISTLAYRYLRALGFKRRDRESISNSAIIAQWKEKLFGIQTDKKKRECIPIQIDFEISQNPTEDEILKMVRAIVAQDTEYYPHGNGSLLSTGAKRMSLRWYKMNDREITLNLIISWLRRARGHLTSDNQILSGADIVAEWKEKLFNSVKDLKGFPIQIDFEPSEKPTVDEIDRIIRAIVEQDSENYPDRNANKLSTDPKFLSKRYKVGNQSIALKTLVGWSRRAQGYRASDFKTLSNKSILDGWKERIFGIKSQEKERELKPIDIDFELSAKPTEEEIEKVVRAIVAQDSDLYPEGDASPMSGSRKYLNKKRYKVGGRELTLATLIHWIRRARGFKTNDYKILKQSEIMNHWKKKLFGIETEEKQLDLIPIKIDFKISKIPSEEEINRIVKEIVAQDDEAFPRGNIANLSTNNTFFQDRKYLVGDQILTFVKLAGWFRRARGFKVGDYKELKNSEIVRLWREALFESLDFKKSNPEEIESFIQKANLTPILDLFPEDPAHLIEALSFLKKDEFKNKDVTEFVKAYLGLKVEKGPGAGITTPKEENDSWDKRRKYILAILQALDAGQTLDLSELNFHRQLNLLIRLSRKAFEENPEKLIEELETLSERATHSFIQRLQKETAHYFKETLDFEIQGMRTFPYGYQKEGAHFFVTHDKAILADEAGMGKSYQVIAATEALGLKRILWVTTASNKETLREEIFSHSQADDHDVKIVISGNPKGRREQIQSLNGERYVITNYETLVMTRQDDPEGYRKLTSGLDLIVVDEAQLTDNPATLRTKAIHSISSPRRWLLTATPYQNKPENIWSLLNWLDPEKHPDFNAFKQMYTQNTDGLILLHSELNNIMLRRTKKDTLSFFLPPTEAPFDRQLADGVPRLPQKFRIPPEMSGTYPLSPEQADLIAWMTADFKGWVEYFNANLPNGAEPIEIEGINSFLKFDQIHKVIYEPEHFGIQGENPVFSSLDKMVARRLVNGEKVILWAWNTSMVEALERRYKSLGVRRIDGSVLGMAREDARHAFQEDPNVRILVANYQSGGVGLTLTAAHSVIFVQLPQSYPMLYQAEGRHQRLIGMNNIRHAKDRVDVEWMLPKFPEGFVESLEDQKLKDILSHGTLVEQTRQRLEGGEILYNLLLEGYGNINELDKYFKAGIIESMGLNREEKLDYISHLKGEARAYAEVAQALLPLWKLVKGNPFAEENTLRLLENFKDYPLLAQKVGDSFQKTTKAYPEDLEFISSLFQLRNKYIREQMLKRVPDLLVKIYGQGRSLKETSEGLKLGRLSPAAFLAQIYSSSGAGGETIIQIIRELASQRDTPAKRYLEEHFFSGVFGIMGNSNAENLLKEKEGLLSNAPLLERIHMVYRLGLLARTRGDLLSDLQQPSFDTWQVFSQAIERATNQAIAEFSGRSVEQVEEMVKKNPNWINADPILALIAGWQEHNEGILLDQFREVVSHLLDGDYREWRYGLNHKNQGNEIDYLSEHPEFWEEFQKSPVTSISRVMISSQKVKASFMRDYLALIQEARQDGEAVEGRWVHEELQAYRDSDDSKKEERLKEYQQDLRVLGKLFGSSEVTEETKKVLEKYGLDQNMGAQQAAPLLVKADLQEKMTEIRNLVSWMNLDNGFRRIHQNKNPDHAALIRELDAKVKFYRGRKYDKMADHWETLKESLERWKDGELTFKDITIEDTDDPAILTRMGALHPEMTNCFNPNGNPTFNQFVVGALGSKNMKMVVIREQGKIVAIAMMKVKQLEDGTPVLFLERGLYRKGYDFRAEMLNHLVKKAEGLTRVIQSSPSPLPLSLEGEGGSVLVMDEVRGRAKDSDPVVIGTGAYTENEYVESVFGLRRSANVRHRGRIVAREHNAPQPPPTLRGGDKGGEMNFMGIGTSNKPIQVYLQELKDQGVKVVVDVRGAPFSRFYPHFNKERLATALQSEGIEYIWLGDTLGNPKDEKGERTLEGFQKYMTTEPYQRGFARLLEILAKAEGKIALTCAEGAEAACHRKFILADLTKIQSR